MTEIGPGHTWRNHPGDVHTIWAMEDADVLEVWTPDVDDAVRLADDYGREARRGLSAGAVVTIAICKQPASPSRSIRAEPGRRAHRQGQLGPAGRL